MKAAELEAIFRSNEEKLDRSLSSSLATISSIGIVARDASNRERLDVGHGLHRLWWGYHFERTWGNNESESFVSLRISYSEPDSVVSTTPVIYGTLFFGKGGTFNLASNVASGEIGKPKSIRIGIDDLLKIGLESFVIENIKNAAHAAGKSL